MSLMTGIELVGTTVKRLTVHNDIVDVEKDGTRKFGLNISEPTFEKLENQIFAQIEVEIEVDVCQSEEQSCSLELCLEGAFISKGNIDEKLFEERVVVNGAAALIGIARGKIETITANVFNNGKVTIPFVNVIDYYNS